MDCFVRLLKDLTSQEMPYSRYLFRGARFQLWLLRSKGRLRITVNALRSFAFSEALVSAEL